MLATGERNITLDQALTDGTKLLMQAGISTARLDARLLLGYALGISQEALSRDMNKILYSNELNDYWRYIKRRAQREPVAKIIGKKAFWGLDFKVTRDTLDPRPESETIIEQALCTFPDRDKKIRLLDLGVGTGCLIITLLKEYPASTGLGVDISEQAIAVAQYNATQHKVVERLVLRVGSWVDGLEESFDLVVCNPPYIAQRELAELEPELHYDPRQALVAGESGLEAYDILARDVNRLLAPNGVAFFEIGAGQEEAVTSRMEEAGLTVRSVTTDLAGVPRVVAVEMNDKQQGRKNEKQIYE